MDLIRKYSSLLSAGIVIALVFYFAGFKAGERRLTSRVANLANVSEGMPEDVDFASFWKAWNAINEKYVPASTTAKSATDQDKVWGAIEGLAASLGDPYTVFFPPVESEMFESDIRGNFEGVGMEVLSQEGIVTVVAPLKGSPAEQAGLLSGDKIIRINDEEATGLDTEEAVQLIRGPKGTTVKLTVFRESSKEPLEFSVTRDVIDIPTIDTRRVDDVFVIELYSFSAQSPNLFRGALREFINSGSNKLILDLRGNPGGYLEASLDMASWFLPAGKVVVRENFGDGRPEKVYRSKGYDIFTDKLEFVILVDGGSASASEILAGALAEHGKATLVGDKTFGKGSVQELIDITPETSLKLTVARWLTPNGSSISEVGITPEYVVKRTRADAEADLDPQLEKALEILRN